ncbi:MAG: hypothetical protein ABL999_03085 [Pyrinomonadaceae bacterium]
MKNKYAVVSVLLVMIAVVLGCSSINPLADKKPAGNQPGSNKSLTDKAVDTAVGEQKIGVPECDEVIDLLTSYANNPDDNFVIKAGKSLFVNKIKESIKKAVEENKTDKTEMAKTCKEAKVELEKYKAEEDKKAANK